MFESATSDFVVMKLGDGREYTLERCTPNILIELGMQAKAANGLNGNAWLSFEDCLKLIKTIEGMKWLTYRCACKHHPDVRRNGPVGFEKAVSNLSILIKAVDLITEIEPVNSGEESESGNVEAPEVMEIP